jgi:hypothetical protein
MTMYSAPCVRCGTEIRGIALGTEFGGGVNSRMIGYFTCRSCGERCRKAICGTCGECVPVAAKCKNGHSLDIIGFC